MILDSGVSTTSPLPDGLVPIVTAEEGVHWPTVAVSWAFSLITTLIILGIAAALLMRKRRRKRSQKEESTPSFRRELSVQSEASDMTRVSLQSTQPLYNSAGYKRVPVRESTANRRKSDYISSWCSKYGLSEVIAANLRDNGFASREQVESLRATDVMTLELPNLAQRVQLRNVLEQIQRTNHDTSGHKTSFDETDHGPRETSGGRPVPGSQRKRSGSSDASRRQSSMTDESPSLQLSTPSPKQLSPGSGMAPLSVSTHFQYPRSLGQLQEETPITMIPQSRRHTSSRLSFHGILSDSGLYGLAECLGTEWRHLAAVLGVPKAQQDHFLHDYPSNTKQQICEMLRHWREFIAKGEKEQVKAELATALSKIKRKDLADEILREQVHGSDPNLRGPLRTNSVV